MEYTAFKAGDKVSWNGTKAVVLKDSSSDNPEVEVRIDGQWDETWEKLFNEYIGQDPIPVVLDAEI